MVNSHRHAFTLEPPGSPAIPSVFILGLHKAGSTLLNGLMKPLVGAAGLRFVSFPQKLRELGVRPRDIPSEINQAFAPTGYAFGGFRSLQGALALPPWASGRAVLLVRDPRDMLTSLYFAVAHEDNRTGQGIGGDRATTAERRRREATIVSIDEFALGNARLVANRYRVLETKLEGIEHKLYRYEDIIFEKATWAKDMVTYLGLDVPSAVMESAVAAADVRPEVEDATQHVRKVTPGDHAEKLKAATIAQLNAQLAPILRKYGYA